VLQQNTADEIAALLAANPGRLFSIADISRALNHSLHRVTRALAVLEDQQRATVIQVGRYMRWKALARRG
jgi:predicted AAA+ superfamily ATPase